MASMKFKPWERVITDIRLVPKLVMLMVFSTVLIIVKQLWDANTFYDSVVLVQKDQAQEVSHAQASFIDSVLRSNGEDATSLAEKTITALVKSRDNNHYTNLVERDTGKVLGHPSARTISDLTQSTESGPVSFTHLTLPTNRKG